MDFLSAVGAHRYNDEPRATEPKLRQHARQGKFQGDINTENIKEVALLKVISYDLTFKDSTKLTLLGLVRLR